MEQLRLFCAADDQGPQNTNTFQKLLKQGLEIGAAATRGTVWRWTGNTAVNFIFPGYDVLTDRQSEFNPIDKPVPRSNITKALAAYLAALALYCIQFPAKKNIDLRSLKETANALRAIGLTQDNHVELRNCFNLGDLESRWTMLYNGFLNR